MWRTGWDSPVILPADGAFGWVNKGDPGLLFLGQESLGGPRNAQIHVTGNQGGLGAIAVEQFDARDKLGKLGLGFIQLFGISSIDIVTERQKRGANQNTRVIQ